MQPPIRAWELSSSEQALNLLLFSVVLDSTIIKKKNTCGVVGRILRGRMVLELKFADQISLAVLSRACYELSR